MSTTSMTRDFGPSVARPPRIRPPDPTIAGTTMTYMAIKSDDAVRRLLDLAFRDARTALDLTYGAGRFWRDPMPPGLVLTTNNIDPTSDADLHLDYRETGLEAGSFDVPIFDPPHTADNGAGGLYYNRYGGTAKGNAALIEDIQAGVREAWRIARVGVVVKVTDASHGGEWVALSDAVKAGIPMPPYFELRTVRAAPIRDPKHRVQRVPKSNGAVYLVFRKDGHRHLDFDRLFARQERGRNRRTLRAP